MKLQSPDRFAWFAAALLCLLILSSPATAADTPRTAKTIETIADMGPDRQINPLEARARMLLDGILFRYEHIYFDFDSDKLLPGALIALERKVEWMRKKPSARAIIEGHSDIRGPGAYNLKLGQRRAQAVRAFLLKRGIEPQRIQIVTLGEKHPQVPGNSDAAWSWNRRAEIRLQ